MANSHWLETNICTAYVEEKNEAFYFTCEKGFSILAVQIGASAYICKNKVNYCWVIFEIYIYILQLSRRSSVVSGLISRPPGVLGETPEGSKELEQKKVQ